MGGPAAQFKAFADATAGKWFTSAWKDKIAAGFTVSMSPSGDKLTGELLGKRVVEYAVKLKK